MKTTILAKAIRTFEGAEGWKTPDSEPFSVERQRFADLKANGLVEEHVDADAEAVEKEAAAKAAAEKAAADKAEADRKAAAEKEAADKAAAEQKAAPTPKNKMALEPSNKAEK